MWSRSGTRALPYVGAIVIFLGVALILLGWRGAANTPLLFEQVPYLISGGQLGAALVTLGGFLYFAYWLTVVAQDQRETHRLLQALLEQGSYEPVARKRIDAPAFVATGKGSMLHLSDCPVVRERADLRSVATTSGRAPCGICRPFPADVEAPAAP